MDHTLPTVEDVLGRANTNEMAQETTRSPVRVPRELGWESLPLVEIDRHRLSRNLIVTSERSHPASAVFDMMRTKTLQAMRQNEWVSLAVTSPTSGCGKTMITVNLAFSLAHQFDCRTILVDLNLRSPAIETTLGVAAQRPIEDYLSGNCGMNETFQRIGTNLAIGTARHTVEWPAEMLQSANIVRSLKELRYKLSPTVILYDMPPILGFDDVTAFLPNVDCALLVAAAEQNTFEEISACERHLCERTNLLGVVLNRCRHGTSL